MLNDVSRSLALAQTAAFARFVEIDPPEVLSCLSRAVEPDEIRKAVLEERPALNLRRELPFVDPTPHRLRQEAAAVGALDATAHDLAVRRMYPSLDLGVYCASHAMGKPSRAWTPALAEHLTQLTSWGIGAWEHGLWADVLGNFTTSIVELIDSEAGSGDVASFTSFSDGFSAVLLGLGGGRLVTTAGHFTSAHYIHEFWSHRTGGNVVTVGTDDEGCVEVSRLIDALTPDTTVVSLTHVFWRNGFVQDIYAVSEAMMDVCPGAALLLDVYQSLGTVPLAARRLPERTAVLGGGIKQLRAGTGAGFAWLSTALLSDLKGDRSGWFAHENPLAFASQFTLGPGAARFRTGVPSLIPLVSLISELRVFAASADGSLTAAVARARRVTSLHVEAAVHYARSEGLTVEGPQTADRRGAFCALRVSHGERLVEALGNEGVVVDYRPDHPGASSGVLRMSANHASFQYELLFAVERLLAHM
jgi:kynureninase